MVSICVGFKTYSCMPRMRGICEWMRPRSQSLAWKAERERMPKASLSPVCWRVIGSGWHHLPQKLLPEQGVIPVTMFPMQHAYGTPALQRSVQDSVQGRKCTYFVL